MSLVVSLLMLIVILLLGTSAAQIALQAEKSSRNDRDRQVAFQAAEAALMDAEMDIEHSPDPARSRSDIFSSEDMQSFPESGCNAGISSVKLGLCAPSRPDAKPAWAEVDFLDKSANASTVPYGQFTGASFQTGAGPLPDRSPRYIIEPMMFNYKGHSAEKPSVFYRITAIGFGMREETQVVLQTYYRKGAK
ncbi:pilus assembly PilX family protein [Noviherbaspirillum aerium]|uniref:pilus assembly PilX family protein n=1 Tax=Noviherbaspirillum aerium TaxID=2588497 RepID=UPI00124C354B|nr:PilX N-terminal domain-containing pilus assembly protein [Noviherbaspirillum aerium]